MPHFTREFGSGIDTLYVRDRYLVAQRMIVRIDE